MLRKTGTRALWPVSLAVEQSIRAQFSGGLGREVRFRPTGVDTVRPDLIGSTELVGVELPH